MLLFDLLGAIGGWSFYNDIQPYNNSMPSWPGALIDETVKIWGGYDSSTAPAGGHIAGPECWRRLILK
jgi:hypothetical protein